MPFPPEERDFLALYQELQSYIGWQESDAQHILEHCDVIASIIPDLVDDFYGEIAKHSRTREVITEGDPQIERLKLTLEKWLNDLLVCDFGATFVSRRWQVGWRHVEIGLDPAFCGAAMARLRAQLNVRLGEIWKGTPADLALLLTAISRLLDLDLAMIDHAYRVETLDRHERTQRLIAIGQTAGNVAHELRNPLNVIKTSAYYLLNADSPSPEKVRDHYERIDRQVVICDDVIRAISDFSRLSSPQLEHQSLNTLVRDAISTIQFPDNIELKERLESEASIDVDPTQISIVVANLLRNAHEAMPNGGAIEITTSDQGGKVVLSIQDEGDGIDTELLKQIMEPMFTTKPRGMGLGLSLTKAILEKHRATLEVSSLAGKGCEFVVRFPTTESLENMKNR